MFSWLKKDSKETDKKLLLDAWKKCVDVQMHFNDMEMKIRSLAVTVITAISGAIGYLLKENIYYQKEFIVLLSFVGAAAWLCFYLMDRFMYHKLLIGAVKAGIETENELKNLGINVALGEKIKEASPLINLFGHSLEMHSNQKLDFFYITVPCICINGILAYLHTNLLFTILVLIILSLLGMYTLAKGYYIEGNKAKYKWSYFIIFLFSNIILFFFLFYIKEVLSLLCSFACHVKYCSHL